jgi:hypothetical protein
VLFPHFFSSSSPPRSGSCAGYKLASPKADAVTEMKYILAALYSKYSTTIVDDTGIEQSDSYTAPPKSDKLIIKLERLKV